MSCNARCRKRFAFKQQASNTGSRNLSYVGDAWQISPDSFNLSRRGARFPCGERGSGEGNRLVTRVDHPASGCAELSSSRGKLRAITSNSFSRSRPPYRSPYLVAHPTLRSGPPCTPSFQALSPLPLVRSTHAAPVRVFTRVLEFCQYHTSRLPNKSIPPHPVRMHGTFGSCTARHGAF